MAFVDQVEDLTSLTVSDTGELSQFLKDGVLDVTNRCLSAKPQDILDFTAVTAEQTGNGLDLGGAKIVSVIREAGVNDDWRSCRQVPPGLQGRVADGSSLHYASKYNPAYMEFEDGKVSVFPDPGANPNAFKVYYVNNVPVDESDAAIAHDSTTIKNFPLDKVHLVPLYAAIKLLQATMASNVISLTTTPPIAPSLTTVSFSTSNPLSITAVAPTAPDAPSFTYTDASVSDIVQPILGISDMAALTEDAPSYTKPILALSTLPTISDLSITTSIPIVQVTSAASVSVTGTPPTYSKPVISLGTTPTIGDLSISATPPVPPSLTAVTFNSIDSALDAGTPVFTTTTLAAASIYTGSEPTYTKPIQVLKAAPVISDLTITVAPPVAPSLTSVTYDSIDSALDAGGPVFTTATIAAASIYTGSAPVYTKPTLVLGAKPSISALSLSTVAPIPPAAPNFTTPTVGAITVSSTTLSNIGVPPTYTKPTLTTRVAFKTFYEDNSTANPFGDNDPGTFSISAMAPVLPSLTTTTINESGLAAPTFIPPVMSAPDFDDTNTWISTEEDSEMLASRIQEIQAKIGEYSARMQEAQAQFAKENTSFQADLQIAVQNAQLESAEDGTKLQKYGHEQNTYQANVSKEVQQYEKKISRYNTELNSVYQAWGKTESDSLQKYSADIQNNLNDFNSENAEYQVRLQEAIQQAQLDAQKAQQQAQLDSTDAQQEASLLLQKENQEYAVSLQKFGSELQKYQAEISTEVQEYTQNLQKEMQLWHQERQTDLQKYSSDIQNELNEYNKENTAYQSAMQESAQTLQTANQVNLAKAQADLQIATSNKERDQQRQLQNATNDMQAIIQDNTRQLSLYQAESGQYQAQVSSEVQEYQQNLAGDIQVWQAERSTDLQKYGSDIQNELNNYNKENVLYQAAIQESIQEIQTTNQVSLAKSQADLQVATSNKDRDQQRQIQNAVNDMGAINSDNGVKIQLYQQELAAYNAIISKEVQEYQQNLAGDIQIWQAERQTDLQKYASDLQNELNKYNLENSQFTSQLQADIQNAQLVDAEEARKLTVYSAELQVYQALVNTQVQEFTNNLQKKTTIHQQETHVQLQAYQSDMQVELNKFNEENMLYQQDIQRKAQNFQKDIQVATQNLQQEVAVSSANLNKNVQLELQNAVQDFQQDVQEYGSKLQKYTSELNRYQQDIGKDIQIFTSQLQADVQDMQAIVANNQALLTKYQGDTAVYQAEIASETQGQTTKMQQYQLLAVQLKAEYEGSFAAMYPQQQQAAPAAQQQRR